MRFPRWSIIPILSILVFASVYFYTQPGGNAPDFSLMDIEGNSFQLSDFRGEIVMIDFMGTWCAPCQASMPWLKVLYEEYHEQIVMLSISTDPIYDTEQRLTDWKNFWAAKWRHARDTSDPPVSIMYNAVTIPTYVIIDKKGDIRNKFIGITSGEPLSDAIEVLLNE
jgi:peroxiredoxin